MSDNTGFEYEENEKQENGNQLDGATRRDAIHHAVAERGARVVAKAIGVPVGSLSSVALGWPVVRQGTIAMIDLWLVREELV